MRLWYFDVSKKVGEKNSCLSGFCQNGGLAPVWLDHVFKECLRAEVEVWRYLVMSVGVCLCLWMSGGVFQLIWVIFRDVRAERQEFFHLLFMRHQNIKTSLSAISKNVWVLPFFLMLGVCQREMTIYSLFWSPCSIARTFQTCCGS